MRAAPRPAAATLAPKGIGGFKEARRRSKEADVGAQSGGWASAGPWQ
jgi:hypothetical protein